MAIKKTDPYESNLSDDEILRRRALQFDAELPPATEIQDGPSGGGRMALFAIAIIAILGVVFYGLNQSPSTSTTTPTAQVRPAPGPDTAATRPPAGTTTGSATAPSAPTPVAPATPSDPAMAPPPPAAAPSGGSSTSPSSN